MGPLLTFQFWWIEIGAQHTHVAAAHNSAVILFDKFPIQKNLPTCMRMTAAIRHHVEASINSITFQSTIF